MPTPVSGSATTTPAAGAAGASLAPEPFFGRDREAGGVANADRVANVPAGVDVAGRDRAAIRRRARHATVAGGRDVN